MCKGLEGYGEEKRAEGALVTLIDLVLKGLLSVKDAAAQVGMTVQEFEQKMSHD